MKDAVKVNRTRRNRGYSFETSIVHKVNDIAYWSARRLGGASTYLPDVIITNYDGAALTLECKSTHEKKDLYIPPDQVLRCIDTLSLFSYYRVKNVVFAFKFGQSKGNKLKEYFFYCNDGLLEKIIDNLDKLNFIKCTRNGVAKLVCGDGSINLGQPLSFSDMLYVTNFYITH